MHGFHRSINGKVFIYPLLWCVLKGFQKAAEFESTRPGLGYAKFGSGSSFLHKEQVIDKKKNSYN